ncbi:MAG TPA: phage tail tape measure protein, partial [Alphaproteobacteria bacterium]|nr:phage tail tape measure protein [Alphaproteobacteria bacterium]
GARGSAGRAAAASREAGREIKAAADEAATGWAAVRDELARYAEEAANWGKGLGNALTSAFRSAEDAVAKFVTTGKFDFKALADSILADITRIALRSAILGPLANALGDVGGGGGIFGNLFGGGGGMAGLRPDEVPAILQRGEMVLSRSQLAAMGSARDTRPPVNVVMNISTPDANSFRYAQGQIAADAARAMERARRNL